MATSRAGASPLALAVLATLYERPMHPYEIARLMRRRGKDGSIKIRWGSLYTVVARLAEAGLVESAGTDRAGKRPERTVYRITDDGREELQERLRRLLGEPVKEYPGFEAALSLIGVLPPDEAMDLIAGRLAVLEVAIASEEAAVRELAERQQLPRVLLLETEYALAMKRAEAQWCRGVLEDADKGVLEIDAWRRMHAVHEFPPEWADRPWMRAELRHQAEGGAATD
ncbi:hypothetical protein BIV57_05740 [Mangrovactinospora gilvigrisea]|uniref:Transcription regulator PadR N-terminal domain-containing protein n=1 Tax=Mangrovactinospora gilvigrisea TaxID=1428644 RepID=A0A1J7CA51_9ACTN|nr:PadR family transcriptional regulator [Mangrovactinospora gilvigrisea]OIV38396.1 hypothetical protein BIV57_05740 [Mangrovactinospora gilvigrisea]